MRTWTCLVLVALAGCAAPEGHVAREWSAALRELGITPVFPPREDVQVGDIYFDAVPPDAEAVVLDEEGFVPLGLWVSRMPDAALKLSLFYGDRPGFPPTPPEGSAQPIADANIFTDADVEGRVRRMRVVGFPGFLSATMRTGGLAGVIPAEALAASLDFAGQSAHSVTVSVPRAESCGVPAAELAADLFTVVGGVDSASRSWEWSAAAGGFEAENLVLYLPEGQIAALRTAREEWEDDPANEGRPFVPYGYLRVITEVYYAREIDVQVSAEASAGGSAEVSPPGAAVGAPPAPTPGVEPTLEDDVENLNAALEAGSRAAPGAGTRFLGASRSGVSLRTTFERPVAIGYRYLSLKLHADGRVEGAGHVGSVLATAPR